MPSHVRNLHLIIFVFALFLVSLLVSYLYLNDLQSTQLIQGIHTRDEDEKKKELSPRIESKVKPSVPLAREGSEVGEQLTTFGPELNFTFIAQDIFAFSAYVDERSGNMKYPYVRIPVISPIKRQFKCRLTDREMQGESYELSENHAMFYRVFIINCKLPHEKELKRLQEIELGSVSYQSRQIDYRRVPIVYRVRKEEKEATPREPLRLSICLPQLFGSFYSPERIIEFIELNRLQGAARFHIYLKRESLEPNVRQVLEYYNRLGIVELIDFRPNITERMIWYHGQLVAITDCHLRTIGLSQYVAFHDFDEFFVPLKASSLLPALDHLFSGNVASIRVPTFYTSIENKTAPITMHNFAQSQPDERLTKCIIRPKMVFEQGIHHTSRQIQDHYENRLAKSDQIAVFHYKKSIVGKRSNSRLKELYGETFLKTFEEMCRKLLQH